MNAAGLPVADLTRAQAQWELARLAAEIKHHDELYYQNSQPEISDADYDALKQRNAAIEARFPDLMLPESPSKRVGLVTAPPGRACAAPPCARTMPPSK